MKRQMKKWLGIFAAAFICFSPVSALAAETDTPLTITSGLDLECEEAECTFSEARIVYGEAEPDTWPGWPRLHTVKAWLKSMLTNKYTHVGTGEMRRW